MIILLLVVGGGVFWLTQQSADTVVVVEESNNAPIPVEPDGGIGDGAEPLPEMMAEERGDETMIGSSVSGEELVAYHYGTGDTEILLVGGTHGSYSPNTSVLGENLMEYFEENPEAIPEDITVTIIPNLNPDGFAVGGTDGSLCTLR